jgi:hypothetical protein
MSSARHRILLREFIASSSSVGLVSRLTQGRLIPAEGIVETGRQLRQVERGFLDPRPGRCPGRVPNHVQPARAVHLDSGDLCHLPGQRHSDVNQLARRGGKAV